MINSEVDFSKADELVSFLLSQQDGFFDIFVAWTAQQGNEIIIVEVEKALPSTGGE